MTKVVHDDDEGGDNKGHWTLKRTHVVEQRVSNLAQGLLTLGTMSGPLLRVLHLIPQGVLAGLFFIMGYQALEGNGVTLKLLFLVRDAALTDKSDPLHKIERRAAIWAFVGVELVAFGATFAITQSVAAVGFPVFILALIPIRALLLPRWFTPLELSVLDAPTASPFTMEGLYGGRGSEEDVIVEEEDAEKNAVTVRRDSNGEGRSGNGGALLGRERGQDEFAETGEGKSGRLSAGSAARRRNSNLSREEEDAEAGGIRNVGVNRRHASKSSEA